MTITAVFAISLQLVFAIIFYSFGTKSARIAKYATINSNSPDKMDTYMWYAILFFTLIVSIRYNVGVDCESYADSLKSISNGIYDEGREGGGKLESLGIVFAKISIFFGNSRVILLGIYGFLEAFFIWYSLKGRKELLPYIGLTIILGPIWFSLNNGLRQITVACLFTYAVQQLIDNKDWKKYLVLIVIGYFLHSSDLILLPFVFLLFYDKLPNRWLLIGLQIACVILGGTTIMNQYFSQAGAYINMLGYSGYADSLDNYINQEGLVSNYGPRRIVMLASYLFVMYKSKEMDKFYAHDKFFRVTILLSTLYACLSELFLGSFFLFSRPLTYFRVFVLISQGYLLYYLKSKKQLWLFAAALIVTCSYVILECLAVSNDLNETSTYKTILFRDYY